MTSLSPVPLWFRGVRAAVAMRTVSACADSATGTSNSSFAGTHTRVASGEAIGRATGQQILTSAAGDGFTSANGAPRMRSRS